MRTKVFITVAMLAALVPTAQAAESVTLRNGFQLLCDHHAQVDGRVRLYLSAGEDNYIEFAPDQVASTVPVPDPPSQPIAPAQLVSSGKTDLPATNTGAQLSEADLGEMLARAGQEHNLDVDLLSSLVKTESGGNTRAVSHAGARGLMQLMPSTAATLGVQDSFKPEENVRGGSVYLDSLLTRYRDNLALALAAYNAGPLAVDKYRGIPPYRETQAYVAHVIHEFNRRVLAREAQAKQAVAASAIPPARTAH
jgi:soluble lytic murein transglycosylase-like protein